MKKKEEKIPYVVRLASAVAHAVAEDLQKGSRPMLLNFPLLLEEGGKDKEAVIRFRFTGSVLVEVFLYNLDLLVESWRNDRRADWVVTRCHIVYPSNDVKINAQWNAGKLIELKETNHWHHPRVMNLVDITSDIGIYWDNASQEGYTKADPEYNQEGHHI